MKEHLINKKPENKMLAYTHRIILGVLITIFIYEFVFMYNKDNFNFLSFEQINLFFNIFYYLFCVIKELNKKDTKKSFHQYFHFCFSLSASIPFIYLVIYLLNSNEEIKMELSILYISFLITPIVSNCLETLIIKRYKPSYIHPIFIVIFLIFYHGLIHFLGKMGMDIGDFPSELLEQFKFVLQLGFFALLGTLGGWWLYKVMTKPRIKKINLESDADSNELSEE